MTLDDGFGAFRLDLGGRAVVLLYESAGEGSSISPSLTKVPAMFQGLFECSGKLGVQLRIKQVRY